MSSTNEEYVEGIYLNDGTLKKFKDADLTQKVEELNINTFGNKITLRESTNYTAPSNGYLIIRFSKNDISGQHYVYGFVNGQQLITLNAVVGQSYYGYNVNSVYVRKGMILKYTGSSYAIGEFLPFV